jgi:hypothetical protein
MEEFAEGGRLSPKKVKEFIPAGTLGIGDDENIWIRKARKDGKTYWSEFLETWNFKRFTPQGYDLKLGIHFSAKPELDEKYGFELKYGYNDFGGFILDIYDADTMLTVNKYDTLDPQKFRDICINVRETLMPNDPILKYEFTELVGKLTSAFEKGELRKEFTEENPKPKFEIGDYVRVLSDGQIIPSAYPKFKEYYFQKPNEDHEVETGFEGYVVASYFEPAYNENRFVVKKHHKKGEMIDEFIIGEKGLKLIEKAPSLRDEAMIVDTTFLYPTAPSIKAGLGFRDPSVITSPSEAYKTKGTIFTKGQDPYTLMPIYGIYSYVLEKEILVGIQGMDYESIQFLKEKKIKINSNEESIRIQEYAFSKGFGWLGTPIGEPQTFSSFPAYFEFNSNKNIFVFENEQEYNNSSYEEITLKNLGLEKDFEIESSQEIPVEEMEFSCKVDSTKINSPFVGAFYSKNKDRIEKLKSEFSCKILESLVYLSDYENCGGGVQLPIQEVIEEDDLLGAIRNLK